MKQNPSFFVVGTARSGTTSLCRILDAAANAVCLLEPAPNLNSECRDVIDNRYLGDIDELLERAVLPRIREKHARGLIYGEKNVTLAPFIEPLHRLLDCKFVYVQRDGRDVVSSLINWHNQLFGSIYRECTDPGSLNAQAYRAVSALALEDDTSDYSRPRPAPGDIWYDRWERFSRFEMCAWYWSRMNDLYLRNLHSLPAGSWIAVDYTRPSAADIGRVAEFLGLKGLTTARIQSMLDAKINSLEDRVGESGRFPRWPDWSTRDRCAFDAIAAKTMQQLNYYSKDGFVRPRPPGYGDWWRRQKGGLEWYTWMSNGRRPAHEDLLRFVREKDGQLGRKTAVLDVGCGLAVGYADAFADRRFVGLDLSEKEVAWCRRHRARPNHNYQCADIIAEPCSEKFDIVFSQGTIDNTYDMNAYLRALCACSRGWIHVTAYRGWFPQLREHRYNWDDRTTCFYNDLSPEEARQTLEEAGCSEIRIEPLKMESADIPFETRITARVRGAD